MVIMLNFAANGSEATFGPGGSARNVAVATSIMRPPTDGAGSSTVDGLTDGGVGGFFTMVGSERGGGVEDAALRRQVDHGGATTPVGVPLASGTNVPFARAYSRGRPR